MAGQHRVRVRPIRVRATVNLPGLKLGQVAWVDPNEPYIAKCLKKQLVVPVGGEEPGSVAHSEARMGEKA